LGYGAVVALIPFVLSIMSNRKLSLIPEIKLPLPLQDNKNLPFDIHYLLKKQFSK